MNIKYEDIRNKPERNPFERRVRMELWGLIFIAVGMFSLCGGFFDWDWFMNARKARFFVSVIGRSGARLFYGLGGAGLMVFGFLVLMGIIQFKG